jgi:DNA-binding response OmpR family regulator
MSEDKKSFVLYADLIHKVKKLAKEDQAGLFMAILRHVNGEKFEVDSIVVDVIFDQIKRQLERDFCKYEVIKEKRKEYWRLAGS